MTTGRINQVTTFLKHAQQLRGSAHSPYWQPVKVAVGAGSFINKIVFESTATMKSVSLAVLCQSKPAAKTPYSPISQSSNTLPPVTVKQQRWRPL
jgi:hypothetical protein